MPDEQMPCVMDEDVKPERLQLEGLLARAGAPSLPAPGDTSASTRTGEAARNNSSATPGTGLPASASAATAAGGGSSVPGSSTATSENPDAGQGGTRTDTEGPAGGGAGGEVSAGGTWEKAKGDEPREKKKRIRNKEQLHLNSIAQRKYRERKRAEQSELQNSIDRLAAQVTAYKALEMRTSAIELSNHGLQQTVARQMQQINQLEDQVEKQAATIFVQMDQLSQAAGHAVGREKSVQDLQNTVHLQEQVILALINSPAKSFGGVGGGGGSAPASAGLAALLSGLSGGGGGGGGAGPSGNLGGGGGMGGSGSGGGRGDGPMDLASALDKLANMRRGGVPEAPPPPRHPRMDHSHWRRD